jgi:D-alanyl-D-alanine carboxypeptidase (penicillin-binding protein 5/6)
VPVYKGFEKKVPVYVEKPSQCPLQKTKRGSCIQKYRCRVLLYAPIKQKDVVGTLSVYLETTFFANPAIRAGKAIKSKNILQYILDVFMAWFKMVKYE